MQIIFDYKISFLTFIIAVFFISLSSYYLRKRFQNKDKIDIRESRFFQVSIVVVLLFGFFESLPIFIESANKDLLNESIENYKEEGFKVIDGNNFEEKCDIENSIIFLDKKGNEVDKDKSVVSLCI